MDGENNEGINSKLLVRDRLVLHEKFVLFHLMFEIIFLYFRSAGNNNDGSRCRY